MTIAAVRPSGMGLVQMHNFRPGGLLQGKLVIGERAIDLQLQDIQRDVVALPRPLDFNGARELDAGVVLVVVIMRIRDYIPLLVIDLLSVGQEVSPAELDLA